MTTRLMTWWQDLRSTYWALPGGMTVAAAVMALLLPEIDAHRSRDFADNSPLVYTGGADGARVVLGTIAASTITVAGTTFSITIAALTLASSQFGPRLLRNFMRDTGNQIVLGTFIGTFLYCLLVLRRVQSVEEIAFVPYIAITVALVMAIASIGVLIYFIDHAASSIQASHVIASASEDLEKAIDRLFPEAMGTAREELDRPAETETLALTSDTAIAEVLAPRSGYIRAIDNSGLLNAAVDSGVVIRLAVHPGDFVVKHRPIAEAWPGDHIKPEELGRISNAFIIGLQRTQEQDARFPMDQLVEIAVRALSPGINDPFTAISCVDRLGQALSRLANRDYPSRFRRDKEGTIRVIAEPVGFEAFLGTACNQIRQYGRTSVALTIHMLEMLEGVAKSSEKPPVHAAIRKQAALILEAANGHAQSDLDDITETYEKVIRSCQPT